MLILVGWMLAAVASGITVPMQCHLGKFDNVLDNGSLACCIYKAVGVPECLCVATVPAFLVPGGGGPQQEGQGAQINTEVMCTTSNPAA